MWSLATTLTLAPPPPPPPPTPTPPLVTKPSALGRWTTATSTATRPPQSSKSFPLVAVAAQQLTSPLSSTLALTKPSPCCPVIPPPTPRHPHHPVFKGLTPPPVTATTPSLPPPTSPPPPRTMAYLYPPNPPPTGPSYLITPRR